MKFPPLFRRLPTIFLIILIALLVFLMVMGIAPKRFFSELFNKPQVVEATPYVEGTVVIKTKQGDRGFNVEIADDIPSQTKGLMFRKNLPTDSGMLFMFKQPQKLQFWMKDTYIPLDIIFINAKDTIVHIEKNTQPLSEKQLSSKKNVTKVLEINAGLSDLYGIDLGDKIMLKR